MPSRTTRLFLLALLSIAVVLPPGCSTYQNVTGYFNTYYNAKRLFSEAVEELYKTPLKERDTNYFALPQPAGPLESKFDKVIEKGSKIIQFYPQSDWVDDGLMMIGRSDVYLGDYESGIRKFNELLENFPTSGLRYEAKLWNAKAEYYSRRDEDAVTHLQALVDEATTDKQNDILIEALLLQAQIAIEREDYRGAVQALDRTSGDVGERSLRAFGQFQLGQCYEILGDPENALKAYIAAAKLADDPAMEIRARMREGIMLTKTEQYEDAFSLFTNLRDEPLKPEELSLVELEIGNTYAAMGDTAGAFSAYRFVDSTFKHSPAAIMSYYRRGVIYEREYGDFQHALEFYNKAKGEGAASPVVGDAQQRSDNLGRYFSYRAELRSSDSLLMLALNPEMLQAILDSMQAHADSVSRAAVQQPKPDSLTGGNDRPLQQGNAYRDSSASLPHNVTLHESPPPVKTRTEGSSEFVLKRTRERDEGDDETIIPKSARVRQDTSATPLAEQDTAETIPDTTGHIDRRATAQKPLIPHPDSLRQIIARDRFELAGLFFLGMNLPDSAKPLYESVISEHLATQFTPRALYSLAEIHRAKGDTTTTDSLHTILTLTYPTSEYAHQVLRSTGKIVEEKKPDPAEAVYRDAESTLLGRDTLRAMEMFRELARAYPRSPFAPKALYAVGWMFENFLIELDSAAAWYRHVVDSFPSSPYAKEAKPKLAVKDNPKALDQFIHVTEIQGVGHQGAAPRQMDEAGRDKSNTRSGQPPDPRGDQKQSTRKIDKDPDDEPDDSNADEPDEPDDDEPDPD